MDFKMISDITSYISDYQRIICSNFEYIVERYFNSQGCWIDTKFSIYDGRDYPKDDLLRGSSTIYSWIQGRGLEALVNFARFIETENLYSSNDKIRSQIKLILNEVLDNLVNIRKINSGHLFFFLDSKGLPFIFDEKNEAIKYSFNEDSPYNFSDLFCSKGMYSAAVFLKRIDLKQDLQEYCLDTIDNVLNENFQTDQQQLDPKNPVKHSLGRHSLGPYMIAIGATSNIFEQNHKKKYIEIGFKLIDYIIQNHVNLYGKHKELQEYDVIEFIDDNLQPYLTDDKVLSDPGHAIEFVGLALKFFRLIRKSSFWDEYAEKIKFLEEVMAKILIGNFNNGFIKDSGICKLYDLVSRDPINSDMPWWSLPETIRAALECCLIVSEKSERLELQRIIEKCHQCFLRNYIKPEMHYFAIQTINSLGQVVDTIPATPDIDPGYHTGMCLMESIYILKNM